MRSLQIVLATFGMLTFLTSTDANATAFDGGSGGHGYGGHGYGGHGYGGHRYGYYGHSYGHHDFRGWGFRGHGSWGCVRGGGLRPNVILPQQGPIDQVPQGQQRQPLNQNRRVAPNVPGNPGNKNAPPKPGRKLSPSNLPPVPGSLNPQGIEKPNPKSIEIPSNMKGIALLPKADQAAALAQRTCPVTGDLLGSDGKPLSVKVGGRTIFVCCMGCIDEVKANPAKFLKKLP